MSGCLTSPYAAGICAQTQAMCRAAELVADGARRVRCRCEGRIQDGPLESLEPRQREALGTSRALCAWHLVRPGSRDPSPDEHGEKGMAQVLARCWARRWGRGKGKVPRRKTRWTSFPSWLACWFRYCFTWPFIFLILQTGAATPLVVSLTFQQGVLPLEINVPTNVSAEDIRLDSEAWLK